MNQRAWSLLGALLAVAFLVWTAIDSRHDRLVQCQYELLAAHSRADSLKIAIDRSCQTAMP